MKALILFSLLLTIHIFAQDIPENLVGIHRQIDLQKNVVTTTNPAINESKSSTPQFFFQNEQSDSVNSSIRYMHIEGASIGNNCAEAGNGLKSIVGWYLNQMRTSAYGNANGTALWEFTLPQALPYNYVGVSVDGNAVASSFNKNFYLINGSNGNQIWTFDLLNLPYTVNAGPIAITRSGNFIIAAANSTSASDSSTIFGFNAGSNVPVWSLRIGPSGTIGAQLQGAKISGNDSLVIINTYIMAYVIRTYTGQVLFTGTVNPLNNNGTQAPQGISGNGNIIATINYAGYVRVQQWNGSTYTLLWQHQEPPGTYYNWMSAVDVSYDGSMVAIGTLNFITSNSFDGKVKLFSVSGGSTPLWTYTGCGDEVNNVAFSRNGRFLSGASWGDYNTGSANNLLVWKVSLITNQPWFAANSTGSFFSCAISDDGQTVIGSGKRVHARTFGSGGILYNLAIDTAENPVGIINNNTDALTYSISQNYPNPFNPTTLITYQIPSSSNVKLSVFDILGREVSVLVDKFQTKGEYKIKFDAGELPSGVYFYRIQAGDFSDSKIMTLIK